MKFGRYILLAVAVLALARPAFSQTTNFIPKAPPRSYNSVARLDYVGLDHAVSGAGEEEHLFVPFMGSQPKAAETPDAAASRSAPPAGASRIVRRPARDGDAKPAASVSEIVADSGRANDPAMREGGVVASIMKQRAVSDKAAARIRDDETRARADSAEEAASSSRNAGFQAVLNRDSVWHSQEEVAAMLAEQSKAADATLLSRGGGAAVDPFSRNARGLTAGGGGGDFESQAARRGADYSPAPDAARSASLFDGGSPSLFGASQALPQNGSRFSAPGGGLYSRDEPPVRMPAAPAPPFGGGLGAGDLKKPTTLPW